LYVTKATLNSEHAKGMIVCTWNLAVLLACSVQVSRSTGRIIYGDYRTCQMKWTMCLTFPRTHPNPHHKVSSWVLYSHPSGLFVSYLFCWKQWEILVIVIWMVRIL
jgi:hypothetical protein